MNSLKVFFALIGILSSVGNAFSDDEYIHVTGKFVGDEVDNGRVQIFQVLSPLENNFFLYRVCLVTPNLWIAVSSGRSGGSVLGEIGSTVDFTRPCAEVLVGEKNGLGVWIKGLPNRPGDAFEVKYKFLSTTSIN
ncbi:hypothetical protein [Roseibium sp.]|uniref:hypothetical protein n=1 Tax=Roseibium sp. TaxID=1936156 RepID=UPI003B511BEB